MLTKTPAVPRRYCPEAPTARQLAFLALGHLEALYGGAAGGGKSSALLMAALQYVHVPGYAALLLRRSYADLALPGALMDRAEGWLGDTEARWCAQDKQWQFPSGATLTFGYLESEKDKYRYQGAELHFIGFDEATQFGESQYRYLLSRLRRKVGLEVPLRARLASNPGGVGHEWVRRMFVVEGRSRGRPFIPARLADNPGLDQRQYRRSLARLDHLTRAQLLDGNWDVLPNGGLFQRGWFEITGAAPAGGRCLRYWDLAATLPRPGSDPDWTVGARVRLVNGAWIIEDMVRLRGTPRTVEAVIRQTAELDGRQVPIRMEQEPGSSGVAVIDHYARRVLVGFDFKGDRKTGDKTTLARPVSAAAEQGNVRLLSGLWCSDFLDEAEAFPQGPHDDQIDAVSGAFRCLAAAPITEIRHLAL